MVEIWFSFPLITKSDPPVFLAASRISIKTANFQAENRLFYEISYSNPPIAINNGANTSDTTVISLIRILMDGPDVSLNGSPTVSPVTVALCTSLPLPPKLPSSTYFLALSHAPPAFAMKMASTKPLLNPPISRPSTPGTPKISPVAIGAMIAISDGITISRCAPFVEIATQRS